MISSIAVVVIIVSTGWAIQETIVWAANKFMRGRLGKTLFCDLGNIHYAPGFKIKDVNSDRISVAKVQNVCDGKTYSEAWWIQTQCRRCNVILFLNEKNDWTCLDRPHPSDANTL